ncbi:MarR family winged helix-turn-helix transcriptional regulator [Geomonas anaerohicana]|uniref:MarR family transcriptional regulator n=1 Tax=Geomonas anaerohicana TaxID=2798583 RepID=A0ABS0YBU1_9BACT|nr:MarR family transcriptional regulator [Geomonas anaerohicana]MBJ6749784.1 MarR family transcriptional regulator [Geomonas anaerohicana]
MAILNKKIDKQNLLYRMGFLTRRWRQMLDSAFQSLGLTDAAWRPLLHLHHMGDGIRQKDLAASLGIEGPSLTRILDQLIAKGLIERNEDASDRRAKLLTLTPPGREMVSRITKEVTALEHDLLSELTDPELDLMFGFVERLEKRLQETRSALKS